MNADNAERRTGIPELANKLGLLEQDVAVIKNDITRQVSMRKVIWGLVGMVFIQLTAAVFAYGKLTERIEHVDVTGIRKDASISLVDDRLTRLMRNTYTKEQEQQLHDTLWQKVHDHDDAMGSIRKDIRAIYSNLALLPPRPLLDRVTKMESELKWLLKQNQKRSSRE